MQLDIFDPENRTLTEAFQAMLEMDFPQAVKLYQAVLDQHPGQEQALEYSLVARQWERFFRQCDPRESNDDRSLFWQEILENPYQQRALQNVQDALMKFLAAEATKARQWWLDEVTHLSDLYLKLGLPEKAEQQLHTYQKAEGLSAYSLLALSWSQHLQGKLKPAGQHYVLGCFQGPSAAMVQRFTSERLKDRAEKEEPAWLPAYGWLMGLLPLLNPGEIQQKIAPQPTEVFAVYSTLYHAEKARRSQAENLVALRKKLKETAPKELFKGYMERVQKQQARAHLW